MQSARRIVNTLTLYIEVQLCVQLYTLWEFGGATDDVVVAGVLAFVCEKERSGEKQREQSANCGGREEKEEEIKRQKITNLNIITKDLELEIVRMWLCQTTTTLPWRR